LGITVPKGKLRHWLGTAETKQLLSKGSAASLEEAQISLARLLFGGDDPSQLQVAGEVLRLILFHLLKALQPTQAMATSAQWLLDAEVDTRQAVTAGTQEILDVLTTDQQFESSLATLPQLYQEAAHQLIESWPRIKTVVADLTAASNRRAVLEQWHESRPDWFADIPIAGRTWLACVSSAYGADAAAVELFDEALAQGAFPRTYWLTRAAHVQAGIDRARAIERLGDIKDQHPYANGLFLALTDSFDAAVDALSAWTPETPDDSAQKAVLRIQLEAARGDISLAIAIAEEAAEATGSTGAMVLAAQYLAIRAVKRGSGHPLADAQRALSWARRARDARRRWLGDSTDAIVIGARVAQMIGATEEAWRLTRPAPEGEASDVEASHPKVRREAALAAAIAGRFITAQELVAQSDDAYATAAVAAIVAEMQGDQHAARAGWRQAWEAAVDDNERLQAARGIAEVGGTLPDLSTLQGYDDAIAELRLIESVLSSDDRRTRLRANAHKSKLLLIRLAEDLSADGDLAEAAQLLFEAGERDGDARLLSMAASRFRDAGLLDAARRAATRAISTGGTGWPGLTLMQKFLVEVNSAEGNWHLAVDAARNLVALDGTNVDALWALTRCLVNRGDTEEAWKTLSSRGAPLDPRTRDEAVVWVGLHARFATRSRYISQALKLMQRWPDDEALLAAFLQSLHTSTRADDDALAEADAQQLLSATEDFLARFPGSQYFRSVPMGPPEDPLAPFAEGLRRQYEQTHAVFERVSRGELPLGVLSTISGRSLTEASLRRAAGGVIAFTPGSAELEAEAAAAALNGRVVVDQTAVHSLALLDDTERDALRGSFTSIVTTDDAYKDALVGRDALTQESSLSIGWDPVSERPSISSISEQDARALAARAETVVGLMSSIVRRPRPKSQQMPQLAPVDADWMSALDLAAAEGLPYWSDDAAQRVLARTLGVPTFSTASLLRALVIHSRMTAGDEKIALATYLNNFYAQVPFVADLYRLAASQDNWRARGVASALTRLSAWQDTEETVQFSIEAMQRIAPQDLNEAGAWADAAATGLIKIAGDFVSAQSNLALFLVRLLEESWIGPTQFAVGVRGVRAAVKRETGAIEDPLPDALSRRYATWLRDTDHATASMLLMSIISACPEADQGLAARTVLLQRD
jgi:hypothetical protein